MFLDEFEKYRAQYQKGIKKIAFRTTRPKVLKEPVDLKLEKSPGNYDLYFNTRGTLLESVHERAKQYKVVYGYDERGRLDNFMEISCLDHEIESQTSFFYGKDGKISKEIHRISIDDEWYTDECTYARKANIEEINVSSEYDRDCVITTVYDEKKRVVEEKFMAEDGLIWWDKKEYNEANQLINETSLDQDGIPDGVNEYFYNTNGVDYGYHCTSEGKSYRRDYIHTLNDRGHWILQVVMNDGEPIIYYSRDIEYY